MIISVKTTSCDSKTSTAALESDNPVIYDAIVVGARCAGAPTAMLLAQKGYEVLLIDRATFPSNMIQSTHLIHPPGIAYLKRWGLLDEIEQRCAGFNQWTFDLHGVVLNGVLPAEEGVDISYAPRRQMLDEILVRAAERAGVEVREGCRVTDLIFDGDRVCGIQAKHRAGGRFSERARIVIGADGPASIVARCAQAEETVSTAIGQGVFWAYYTGLPIDHFVLYSRAQAGAFAFPCNDGISVVSTNLTYADFLRAKTDWESGFRGMLEHVAPELASQLDTGERVDRLYAGCTRMFVRKAYGPGWALVGDAGMKKDPITAQGIAVAFEYAQKLADAIDAGWAGRCELEHALGEYERERDERLMPFYDFTVQLAQLAKPAPEQLALYRALQGSPDALSQFFGCVTLSVSPSAFLAPENIDRIIGGVSP